MTRKKTILFLITLILLSGCSNTKEKVYVYDEPEVIDFYEYQKEVFEQRKQIYADNDSVAQFNEYAEELKNSDASISVDDIKAINNYSMKDNVTLTKKQMQEDVQLLFRVLRYAYGAYYYFGGDDVFFEVEDNILNSLSDTMPSNDFAKILREQLSTIIRDGHFSISSVYGYRSGGRLIMVNPQPVYYYSDLYFNLDDNNDYYLSCEGEKWYYVETENDYRIVPTLLKDGRFVYNLMSYSLEQPNSAVILTNGVDQRQENNIVWTAADMDFCGYENQFETTNDYCLLNTLGDKIYTNFGNYDSFNSVNNIIFDNQGNGGGSFSRNNGWAFDPIANDWFINVIGENAQYRNYSIERLNGAYDQEFLGREEAIVSYNKGKLVENGDKNVFVLTNCENGSNGEDFVYLFRTYAKSVVIGVNTGGCEICGNIKDYYLLNSGISVCFGISFKFYETLENLDDIGIEPDIWCDPKYALEATKNLISSLNVQN